MESELVVNGVEYVRKDSLVCEEGLRYCIVRGDRTGVFAGMINAEGLDGKRGTVYNARRIWYWAGAASLSQLSIGGTSKPDDCKFPAPVAEVIITDIIEIIPCTDKARQSIQGVKEWTE